MVYFVYNQGIVSTPVTVNLFNTEVPICVCCKVSGLEQERNDKSRDGSKETRVLKRELETFSCWSI